MHSAIWFSVLLLQTLALCCQSLRHGLDFDRDTRVLTVGEELEGETLPLKSGRRFYRLAGLKESAWYEVKISYPASIPARFDIRLEKEVPEVWLGRNRRLLNTEKMIFKADGSNMVSGFSELYALVTVEAAGVIAKPGLPESELIMFNIVCDELLFGIPHKTRWGTISLLTSLDGGEEKMNSKPRQSREYHPADQRGISEKAMRKHVTLVESVSGALEENDRLNLMDNEGVSSQVPDDNMELEDATNQEHDGGAKRQSIVEREEAAKGRIERASSPNSPTISE
ncbi:hypothetical protein J5N97_011036 [Dioscorea zingiberensis]|uniref:Uncharacterized protein n=1 Tax=Dioscorea zingiberensis TaxID=325984 RepID=A0A9D5D097_9LILI|nr:hypothetical protein J5N97_011036 [Dioscorea zingiberensis]